MAKLALDYRRPAVPVRLAAHALLLFALATGAACALYVVRLNMTVQTLEEAARNAAPAAASVALPNGAATRRAAALQAELGQADEARRALAHPWERLFRALESAAGPDVSLLSLNPSPGKNVLALSGEARDMPALLAYLRRLAANAVFTEANLQSHQVQQDDPQRPIRFVVLLTWSAT